MHAMEEVSFQQHYRSFLEEYLTSERAIQVLEIDGVSTPISIKTPDRSHQDSPESLGDDDSPAFIVILQTKHSLIHDALNDARNGGGRFPATPHAAPQDGGRRLSGCILEHSR